MRRPQRPFSTPSKTHVSYAYVQRNPRKTLPERIEREMEIGHNRVRGVIAFPALVSERLPRLEICRKYLEHATPPVPTRSRQPDLKLLDSVRPAARRRCNRQRETVIAPAIIHTRLAEGPSLFIAHRSGLMDQALDKLRRHAEIEDHRFHCLVVVFGQPALMK
jgi:hypothetical protein